MTKVVFICALIVTLNLTISVLFFASLHDDEFNKTKKTNRVLRFGHVFYTQSRANEIEGVYNDDGTSEVEIYTWVKRLQTCTTPHLQNNFSFALFCSFCLMYISFTQFYIDIYVYLCFLLVLSILLTSFHNCSLLLFSYFNTLIFYGEN